MEEKPCQSVYHKKARREHISPCCSVAGEPQSHLSRKVYDGRALNGEPGHLGPIPSSACDLGEVTSPPLLCLLISLDCRLFRAVILSHCVRADLAPQGPRALQHQKYTPLPPVFQLLLTYVRAHQLQQGHQCGQDRSWHRTPWEMATLQQPGSGGRAGSLSPLDPRECSCRLWAAAFATSWLSGGL